MISPNPLEPLSHGGNLDAARRLFPDAPQPFLDLSTGINPNPYPIPELPPQIFAHLPTSNDLDRLTERAAAAYGAPSRANVVATPGSQILATLLAGIMPHGRAAIVGPTYAEHARVVALAGHDVTTVSDISLLGDADLAIVVNPNNPDGRVFPKDELLDIVARRQKHDGLFIVDEAFMDADPRESLAGDVERANVVVLRSFGKFFGLAGLRLSFALAGKPLAARLNAALGPWPVSGPALSIGEAALSDKTWTKDTRASLAQASCQLDTLLEGAGFEKVGGTRLFSLVSNSEAGQWFERLGRAGIFVRRFDYEPTWLRFGLPGSDADWQRLEAALRS